MRNVSNAFVYLVNFVIIWGLILPPQLALADKAVTRDNVKKFQEALQKELDAPPPKADITDSYASDFVSKVWNEPKYRYMAATILAGEALFGAALVTRARLNKKTWQNQIATAKDVAERLKPVTVELAAAESEVLKALSGMSAADRAELLKLLTEGKKGVLPTLEAALKTEGARVSTLTAEEAILRLEKAYEAWQKEAVAEARVLNAAGAGVKAPAALAEVSAAISLDVRAATRLEFTQAQFASYRDAGFQHMMDKANLGLAKGLGWKGWLWRKSRMGLLMLAIPVITVGVAIYYDRELEKNRRIEDNNTAALADRETSAKTMVPYFHRPVLFAFVKGWQAAQGKDSSVLKRFVCPLEIKEIELDNPSLTTVLGLSLQVLHEMKEADEDILEENGKKAPIITENFYKRLTLKVFEHFRSPLLNLVEKERKKVIADIAFEAYRAFDK